jgi:hypothetical protein
MMPATGRFLLGEWPFGWGSPAEVREPSCKRRAIETSQAFSESIAYRERQRLLETRHRSRFEKMKSGCNGTKWWTGDGPVWNLE